MAENLSLSVVSIWYSVSITLAITPFSCSQTNLAKSYQRKQSQYAICTADCMAIHMSLSVSLVPFLYLGTLSNCHMTYLTTLLPDMIASVKPHKQTEKYS